MEIIIALLFFRFCNNNFLCMFINEYVHRIKQKDCQLSTLNLIWAWRCIRLLSTKKQIGYRCLNLPTKRASATSEQYLDQILNEGFVNFSFHCTTVGAGKLTKINDPQFSITRHSYESHFGRDALFLCSKIKLRRLRCAPAR